MKTGYIVIEREKGNNYHDEWTAFFKTKKAALEYGYNSWYVLSNYDKKRRTIIIGKAELNSDYTDFHDYDNCDYDELDIFE